MFGRSGQMFPRRTFHDAIYEEEYGSDNEDECCRCRGLSAILCWFLSVIILVGLAATVVLTVFFILRSRTMMVKPDAAVDVEMYGKDQNLFESGASSKELLGSNESSAAGIESGKRKKSKIQNERAGPPGSTKNDVDADVNEEQNAIIDSSEDASVSHPRNQHPNNNLNNNNERRNRLQPYSTTSTTTTTEAPVTEEETSSSEEETEQNENAEGSSLFNLFSGPRNPSYNAPHNNDGDEYISKESTIRHALHPHQAGVSSAESYNNNNNDNGGSSAQVLFTESPKVTVTTPNPYSNRRNLQTTRFPTGRTSFSSTTTTTMAPATAEESEEEEDEHDEEENNENDENEGNNDEEDEDVKEEVNNDVDNEENDHDHNEDNDDKEKSSEEEGNSNKLGSAPASASPEETKQSNNSTSSESEMGSESGESQLNQMLLDAIPPHDKEEVKEESSSNEEGAASSSQEFNLSQKVTLTTTVKPTTTAKPTKPSKNRQDTISRLISRNFTRKGTSTTTATSSSTGASGEDSVAESTTDNPSVTTLGPAGHKYDYTMTPVERTKLKIKSAESAEQEVAVTKPPPKFRYRSTTPRGSTVVVTPGPPSTAAPRTRGTTPQSASSEFGIKLGGGRGSVESPIDIVPSPDLSPNGKLAQQELERNGGGGGVDLSSAASSEEETKHSEEEQQFLDVLVGADQNHKTLVTKKTVDGIVTSAILPPWYDTNGANKSISDVMATNGTTVSHTVAKIEDEEEAASSIEEVFGVKTKTNLKSSEEKILSNEQAHKESSKEQVAAASGSEFERLVDMFSKQSTSSEEVPPPQRFGYKKTSNKPIVLKKPGGALLTQASRFIPQIPGRGTLFPTAASSPVTTSSKESNKQQTLSSENSSKPTIPTLASSEKKGSGTSVEETAGDVGRTGVLPSGSDVEDEAVDAANAYYPEEDARSDKIVEQHMVESERMSSDEMMDSMEREQPSHVIDVNIHDQADTPQEVIIEQDNSAPMEDAEGDFVEDDYGYDAEDPPTMAMEGSAPNMQVVPVPEEIVRGGGIRKPMSSEELGEGGDMEPSASSPQENNVTTTTTTTVATPIQPSAPIAVIRRPAYTREEILKSSVKPSPESIAENNNNLGEAGGSVDGGAPSSDEYEEYEDENYEDGSVERTGTSVETQAWSSEKTGSPPAPGGNGKWSEPDQMRDSSAQQPSNFGSVEEEPASGEGIAPEKNANGIDNIMNEDVKDEKAPTVPEAQGSPETNSTGVFNPPKLVSFHENKLSFSPPQQADEEYHSKDGWRPLKSASGPRTPETGSSEIYYNGSQEPNSGQTGSFEAEQNEAAISLQKAQQQYQELPKQVAQPQMPKQIIQLPIQKLTPPQPQQWVQGPPPPEANNNPSKLKPSPMIPPSIPAHVKFPDSEEDHEDRHHGGRQKLRRQPQGQFDRAKYMTRPVPPPIVMRRHPHSTGPYPPPPQSAPPPPPHVRQPPPQRGQMMPQASQQNPQFAEHPHPPPPQGRPPHPGHPHRNFHMRQNPMRRFFGGGGPPQAQPRSGGNIKWPSEEDETRGENAKQKVDRASVQSEVASTNSKRRRRRRAIGS